MVEPVSMRGIRVGGQIKLVEGRIMVLGLERGPGC